MVVIPTVIEKSANTERAYDLYSCLLKERIILLSGEIDDALSSSICAQLLYLSSLSSSDEIQLYINSPGGSVTAGMAIYDTMQFISCPVSTICMGLAASMAAILLTGGEPGKRFALKNSEVMIHQPLGGIQGQAKDIEIAAEHILNVKQNLYKILSEHTGKSVREIQKDADRDHYLSALQAKGYGLIDDIIQNRPIQKNSKK